MAKWLSAYYEDNIKLAADIIKKGGLVAFPTETVYGLGANALDKLAVAKIFEVKNRPDFDPLIVHICRKEDVFLYADQIEDDVEKLIDHFWPGPLTIVVPKKDIIPSIVTAGNTTVALRMPKNNVALKLIEFAGVPIAAPSANPFGYISPTSAFQVADTIGDKIDCILDGGKCQFGLESTVVMVKEGKIFLLRPGALEIEKIEKLLGKNIEFYKEENILSPGQIKKHYSPQKEMILIKPVINQEKIDYKATIEKLYRVLEEKSIDYKNVYLLLPSYDFVVNDGFGVVDYFSISYDLKDIASNLFEKIYLADKSDKNVIVVVGVKKEGLGLSIMNRLEKACNYEF